MAQVRKAISKPELEEAIRLNTFGLIHQKDLEQFTEFRKVARTLESSGNHVSVLSEYFPVSVREGVLVAKTIYTGLSLDSFTVIPCDDPVGNAFSNVLFTSAQQANESITGRNRFNPVTQENAFSVLAYVVTFICADEARLRSTYMFDKILEEHAEHKDRTLLFVGGSGHIDDIASIAAERNLNLDLVRLNHAPSLAADLGGLGDFKRLSKEQAAEIFAKIDEALGVFKKDFLKGCKGFSNLIDLHYYHAEVSEDLQLFIRDMVRSFSETLLGIISKADKMATGNS